jgi:glycosyltransferase involved in cell wall biosynthesis
MSQIFNDKIFNLGFHLNHNYFQNVNRNKINNMNEIYKKEPLKFFCTGGFNAISRKNIDLIVITFYNIFNDNIFLNWELNVYIQGVQIPGTIDKYRCNNIKYHLNNLSYKLIIDKYFEHDIFIHMGSHEGLGIGFYESIYCGTPILTMDWIPNSEIIIDNENGWLTNCSYSDIHDNDNSLLNKGIINEKILKKKIIEIIENKDNTINIINNTIDNIDKISKRNKILFENIFLKILSE